jgi:hypothetical protein
MTNSTELKPKWQMPVKVATAAAIAVVAVLGTFSAPAQARWDDHRGPPPRWEYRDHRPGYYHGYNGGYYRAPPVVYAPSYGYVPPPVVYAPSPGIGIHLPGLGINIR